MSALQCNDLVSIGLSESLVGKGIMVDRSGLRKLLRQLENMGANVPDGCNCAKAQLRFYLARRNWKVVSLKARSVEELRASGLCIGVVK